MMSHTLVPGSVRDHRFPLALQSPIPLSGRTISSRSADSWSFLSLSFFFNLLLIAGRQPKAARQTAPSARRTPPLRLRQGQTIQCLFVELVAESRRYSGCGRSPAAPLLLLQSHRQRRSDAAAHQLFKPSVKFPCGTDAGASPGEAEAVAGNENENDAAFRMHAADDKTEAWGVIAPDKHAAPAGTIKEPTRLKRV